MTTITLDEIVQVIKNSVALDTTTKHRRIYHETFLGIDLTTNSKNEQTIGNEFLIKKTPAEINTKNPNASK